MSESINDPCFSGVVRRHLHFHPVANGKSNKTFAHFARDMRKHEIVIGKRNPKHCSGQHVHNRAFNLDRFFRFHDVDLRSGRLTSIARLQRGPENFRGRLHNRSIGESRRSFVSSRWHAVALREDEPRSRLAHGR